jgi:carboxypeptidase family protein
MRLEAKRFHLGLVVAMAGILSLCAPASGQSVERESIDAHETKPASIVGTVIDVNGHVVPGATVVVQGSEANDRHSITANDNGYFELHDAKPGVPYQVQITAEGFAEWSSPTVTPEPGEFKILEGIQLKVQTAETTVRVTQTLEEVATEQVKVEEKQRVLGFIPNFDVVYDPHPVPLTAKLKFRLALKVATDPITALGIAFLSGTQQAGDTPDYGQGAQGYGKRFGANAADALTDIMIGGAILPSILHQDPRNYYQGSGTTRSRMGHAMVHPFVCKGDNGKWQPNFSSLGGDLASSAISNAYYPPSNRGAGLMFTNLAISTAERVASSLAQEFIVRRFVHGHGDH